MLPAPSSESVFKGYAWSLDTFVDYTWQDLTKLSVIIIVLLVVEVRLEDCVLGGPVQQAAEKACM